MFRSRRLVLAVILVVIVVLGSALPALAGSCDPVDGVFPAGCACAFSLKYVSNPTDHYVTKALPGRDGNVRMIQAGKGADLIFTNMDTGATITTPANGSDFHWTIKPDGTATLVATGHTILFMYPTDIPAGPSTTLYVGRMVASWDAAGKTTIVQESGTKTDICAALGG